MTTLLFKGFCIFRLHYYLLLWSICRTYYAALKMFKVFLTQALLIPKMMKMRWKALAVKLIGSSLVKQQPYTNFRIFPLIPLIFRLYTLIPHSHQNLCFLKSGVGHPRDNDFAVELFTPLLIQLNVWCECGLRLFFEKRKQQVTYSS